jgi:hypothetical protein
VESLRQGCSDLGKIGFVAQIENKFEAEAARVYKHSEKRDLVRVSIADALDVEVADQCERKNFNTCKNGSIDEVNLDSIAELKTASVSENLKSEPPQVKVKNTFIEAVEMSHWRYDPALARPPPTKPFDFLSGRLFWPRQQSELDMVQAIREDYQGLRAVQALDIISTTPTKTLPSKKSCRPLFVDFNQLNAFRKDYQECRAVPFVDFSLEETDILGSGPLLPKNMKKSIERVKHPLGAPLSIIPEEFVEELQFIRDEYQQGRAVPALDYCTPRRVEPTKWLANDVHRLSHEIAFKWHHGKQPKESKPTFVEQIGPPMKGLFNIEESDTIAAFVLK